MVYQLFGSNAKSKIKEFLVVFLQLLVQILRAEFSEFLQSQSIYSLFRYLAAGGDCFSQDKTGLQR